MAIRTLRICNKCGEKKVLTDFAPTTKSHGVQQYKKTCIACEAQTSIEKATALAAKSQERIQKIEAQKQTKVDVSEQTEYKAGYKICSKCGEEKPLTEFYKDRVSNGKQTYRGDCKKCAQLQAKGRIKKYKDTKRDLLNTLTEEQWQAACKHFGACAYCGGDIEAKEHVVPISKGGITSAGNILPSCNKCNSSKGDKNMKYWYVQQPFYTGERIQKIEEWLREHENS